MHLNASDDWCWYQQQVSSTLFSSLSQCISMHLMIERRCINSKWVQHSQCTSMHLMFDVGISMHLMIEHRCINSKWVQHFSFSLNASQCIWWLVLCQQQVSSTLFCYFDCIWNIKKAEKGESSPKFKDFDVHHAGLEVWPQGLWWLMLVLVEFWRCASTRGWMRKKGTEESLRWGSKAFYLRMRILSIKTESHLQIEWWKEPKPQTDLELLKIKQVTIFKSQVYQWKSNYNRNRFFRKWIEVMVCFRNCLNLDRRNGLLLNLNFTSKYFPRYSSSQSGAKVHRKVLL